MSFNPNSIQDFEKTMSSLIENWEENELIGINVYDTSEDYNLKIVEQFLRKHSNIVLAYSRYHEATKEHELYFSKNKGD